MHDTSGHNVRTRRKPVHSLLFEKSTPTIKFDDSRPALLKSVVTYAKGKATPEESIQSATF
jgi:hypothetical protein